MKSLEKLGKIVGKSLRKNLLKRAKDWTERGYSVIPVQGDLSASEPKRPAMRWREFQRRIMTAEEVKAAFRGKCTALGIVCGRISQLLVIDFDDHFRYRRFCRHLPQFAQTYTVKTRRGCHLYFRVELRVASHQFDGGDVKAEGSYVIGAGSVIGGFEYRAVEEREALELDREDVDRLLEYFHVREEGRALPAVTGAARGDVDVGALYGRLAGKIGRNNALYRAASTARGQGMEEADAEKALLMRHVEEASAPGHKVERAAERLLEGQRTIGSAYRGGVKMGEREDGLPNSVRERLLSEQRSTTMARFLDAIALAGWEAESYFTMKEAIALGGKYGLNRKSVMDVLTGERAIFDGKHIISRRYVDYLDSGGLKSRKRGRPVELMFQAPSVGRLLSVLKVSWTPSDAISADDLRSAHRYRVAVHREYVRRLRPEASLRQLGRRVGVSGRTIQRYNRALGVAATAQIGCFLLKRENLRCLPKRRRGAGKNATDGFWLEAAGGRRLPAWRHIAEALLRRGEYGAQVCMRRMSVYSLGDGKAPARQYVKMDETEFVRMVALRGGGRVGFDLRERARDLLRSLGRRASMLRYERVRLFYDTVATRIAEDKVAETINGYVYAIDASGGERRRPARRGVAYRMLKEFGDGNVFLALRDGYAETLASLAKQALGAGKPGDSIGLVAQALA